MKDGRETLLVCVFDEALINHLSRDIYFTDRARRKDERRAVKEMLLLRAPLQLRRICQSRATSLIRCRRRGSHRFGDEEIHLSSIGCRQLDEMMEKEKTKTLIESVFERFLRATSEEPPQFSRDYFERFTQLLTEAEPIFRPTIEKSIAALISPLHPDNPVTFEYQLRLIRYSLRQHLSSSVDLLLLYSHPLLTSSSILRHLSLQIGLLICGENDSPPSGSFFALILQVFSSDPNLYVRDALAQFFSIFISVDDRHSLLPRLDADLLYRVLVLLPDDQQVKWIEHLRIYETLDDTCPAARAFVLQTAKDLNEERPIVEYLQRCFDRSISDYVHQLFAIISARDQRQRAIGQLTASVKALFLFMKEIEIEEIDDEEQDLFDPDAEGLTESICCQLFHRQISSIDLSSIVLEALQPFVVDTQSFLYRLDFYPSTLRTMLAGPIEHEKSYSHLLRAWEHQSSVDMELCELIFYRVNEKRHSTLIYQSFFGFILHRSLATNFVERMSKMIEGLLFEEKELLFQWDAKDCALHFLAELVQRQICPSWLDEIFLRRVMETLLQHTNEYIQASLIHLLATLVQSNLLSPFDSYLNSTFVHFTGDSLGDVVRCALAHGWLILLTKSREPRPDSHRFSFGAEVDARCLVKTIIDQIPRLIGDAGQETERQCLRLIESIGEKNQQLDDVLVFLRDDGCSEEIQRQARRLLFPQLIVDESTNENKAKERFEDQLASILHWFEHPDEHMTLDCD